MRGFGKICQLVLNFNKDFVERKITVLHQFIFKQIKQCSSFGLKVQPIRKENNRNFSLIG
jgi:hypothetical protein